MDFRADAWIKGASFSAQHHPAHKQPKEHNGYQSRHKNHFEKNIVLSLCRCLPEEYTQQYATDNEREPGEENGCDFKSVFQIHPVD